MSETDALLTKFFGVYQQDDRDLRDERRRSKLEPRYQFMARVRMPGGVCTPTQWLALDALARKYGGGTLRLTTRQTVQFHHVRKHHLRALSQGLHEAGLDTIAACGDDNRNVICTANPMQSVAHEAVSTLARAVSARLMPRTGAYREVFLGEPVAAVPANEEPLYGETYLPRKFKIAIAIPPQNDVDVFRARPRLRRDPRRRTHHGVRRAGWRRNGHDAPDARYFPAPVGRDRVLHTRGSR